MFNSGYTSLWLLLFELYTIYNNFFLLFASWGVLLNNEQHASANSMKINFNKAIVKLKHIFLVEFFFIVNGNEAAGNKVIFMEMIWILLLGQKHIVVGEKQKLFSIYGLPKLCKCSS